MVPLYGKKETCQFLRNVPFDIKMCQLVTKNTNLWQSVQYARWLIKPRRILEYDHML